MIAPKAGEGMEKLDHSYIAVGNVEGTTTLESNLVIC